MPPVRLARIEADGPRREAGQLAFPTDSELELFGARMDDAHRLGTLDETDALALPATGHLPEPFEALGLRALAALLSAPAVAQAPPLATAPLAGGGNTVRDPKACALARPHGVTIHPITGELYVTDSYNNRVLKIVK